MLSDEEKNFKASHFENIDELIKTCEMWIQDDDWEAYCRFFDMGAMEELINLIEKQSKEIEELKEENENLLDALNNSIDIRKYWVSKDKIKAKIEEEDKLFFKTKDVRHANRYKAYKELLEKE